MDQQNIGPLYERLTNAVDREVWLLIRQSSYVQGRLNVGSAEVQRQQSRYVRPFGVEPDGIRVVDARGESGRAGADRPQFAALLEAARAGRIGILLLARHDRLGRNDEDSSALFAALSRTGGLVMVDGRCYDPSEPHDKLMLGLQAQFAEYENNARMRWMQLSRWSLVKRLEYRVPLPSGMVWASLDDEEYVRRMTDAGLGAWLTRVQADPAAYRAASKASDRVAQDREARAYYPLPFPDASVARSIELRLAWLRELESVTAVQRRIERDPRWPRPGMVPVTRGRRYVAGARAHWVPVERSALLRWFRSPALYGTYAASSRMVFDDLDGLRVGRAERAGQGGGEA